MTALTAPKAPTAYETARAANFPIAIVPGKDLPNVEMTPKQNKEASESLAKQTHNFVASAYGAYRFSQLPGKTLSFAAEVANLAGSTEVVKPLKDTAKVFNTAANGMIIAYWAWATFELGEQFSKVAKEGAGEGRLLELVRRAFDWVTAGCHSVGSFVASAVKSTLGNVASVTDLTVDSIETYQAGSNWVRADKLLEQNPTLSDTVQEDLKAEKKLQFISGIKSAIAVAAGILGLLGLILSATLVPPIVFLTMGLVTCILSIGKHFYKENMESKPLSRWDFTTSAVVA